MALRPMRPTRLKLPIPAMPRTAPRTMASNTHVYRWRKTVLRMMLAGFASLLRQVGNRQRPLRQHGDPGAVAVGSNQLADGRADVVTGGEVGRAHDFVQKRT